MLSHGQDPSEGMIARTMLEFKDLRGCSDFIPVPGTNDCHLFVLRTEETLDNVISSYGSVVDLEGNVLMPEIKISAGGKFEGCEFITDFEKAAPKAAKGGSVEAEGAATPDDGEKADKDKGDAE